MRLLIAQGVQTFIEVGPGKVLCGLMRQIDRSKTCLNVSDEATPEEDPGIAGQGAGLAFAGRASVQANETQFAGRIAQRVVRFLHPDLRVLCAVVHDHIDDHAAAAARGRCSRRKLCGS